MKDQAIRNAFMVLIENNAMNEYDKSVLSDFRTKGFISKQQANIIIKKAESLTSPD